jgi:branched-chain amino acid transport system ATP-binding protein
MACIQIAQRVQSSVTTWPLLDVEALSKSFGRVAAITNLTFTIEEGQVVGLIGPMCSGRSTILDLLTGTIKPTFGRITVAGEDVTQLGPELRVRRGLVCGPQPANLFLDLTAYENVLLGGGISHPPFFSRRGGRTSRDEAMAMLEFTGLAGVSNVRAADLSPCEQRFLTIAVALATKPLLLLLDGLAVGISKAERSALASLIADIRDNGTSVLIAEQVMSPLTDVCDRILVLSSGKIIADDVPLRIGRNATVSDADLSCSQLSGSCLIANRVPGLPRAHRQS